MLINIFRFRLKNSIKILRNSFIAYLLIFSILTAACVAVSFVIPESNTVNRIKVDVVFNGEDNLTDMVVRYISQMDSVKSVSQFEYCSRDTAFKNLENGNASIILDIPDDLYNSVNNGENKHLNVYILNDSNVVTKAFADIIKSGVEDVSITEATVYAFLNVSSSGQYELKEINSTLGDYIAQIYADIIMHRSRMFSQSVVSAYGENNIAYYYYISLLLIIILVVAGSFGFLYKGENAAVSEKLKIYGISDVVTFNINVIITFIFSFLFAIISSILWIIINNVFDLADLNFGAGYFIAVLLVSLAVSVIINLFYYLCGTNNTGNITFICVFIILFISSGCIIPVLKLPEWCTYINYINPVKYMFELLIKCQGELSVLADIIAVTGMIIISQILVFICKK